MTTPALIALDWGLSNLRSYLLDAEGAVLESRTAPLGIKTIKNRQFRAALVSHCGDWLEHHPGTPVIAAGMVGSQQGWRDTPFVTAPAGLQRLADMAVRDDTFLARRAVLLPGISHEDNGFPTDILRGESVQLFGALAELGTDSGVFILPGAHSKWIRVKDGAIVAFRTYMTGELYELLAKHSTLGHLLPDASQTSLPGFTQGLACAQFQREQLAHMLFSARTVGLLKQIAERDLPGYLSGLLIGEEIACGLRWAGTGHFTLIGSSAMTRLYRNALAGFGHSTNIVPVDVAALGLHQIAQKIAW